MASVDIYTDAATIQELVPRWQQLVERTGGATAYQTPEWALTWQRTFAKNSTPFALALYEGELLVGFAPLCIERPWGVRVVRFMGGDLNDFNCLLAESAYLTQFQAVVAQTLAENAEKWDVLYLTGLDDKDPLGQEILADLPAEARQHRLHPTHVPTIALPGSWEAYQSKLPRTQRYNYRHGQQRLQAHGDVTFQVITEPQKLARALPIFFEARTANWRARKRLHRMVAVQRTSGYWRALQNICLGLASQGRVWLGQLEVGGNPVGWELAFVVNGTAALYLTTYDLRYAHAGPGRLVKLELIHYAIDRGIDCFVLGRGAQAYKYRLGASRRTVENLLIHTNRPRGLAYVQMQALRERVLDLARMLRPHTGK